MGKFQELPISRKVTLADSPEAAVESTEALIIATEWPEFGNVDFTQVRESMVAPLIFDGRNLLDPATMRGMGFIYQGIGRGTDLGSTPQA